MAYSSAISHRFTTVIVMRKAKANNINNMVIDWLMVNPSPLHCCFYCKVYEMLNNLTSLNGLEKVKLLHLQIMTNHMYYA